MTGPIGRLTGTVVILAAGIAPQPSTAQSSVELPKSGLLALSAIELLHEALKQRSDVTLNAVVGEAAGSVIFPRMSAPDTLASLIDRVRTGSAEGGEFFEARQAIEATAGTRIGLDSSALSLFTTELLKALHSSLLGEE